MRIHLCGVRGSTPAVGTAFAGVGGNTSSVALAHDGDETPCLVLDAGTGLRNLTTLLEGRPFRGAILLGHLHWDHTHGLPFFRAGDRRDAATHVYVPEQGVPAVELIRQFMKPPAFPIGPEHLQGSWTFTSIDEGSHTIEGFEVMAREIPHKGGRTFGYRISDDSGSLAYLSDHGPAGVHGPGHGGLGPYHAAALELCAGVDLLIHDAQYTASELPLRASHGHSAAEYAVELARRTDSARVLLFHHDPDRTDDEVAAIERALQNVGDVEVDAAREGDTITIGPASP